MGRPPIAQREPTGWKSKVEPLTQHPQVRCKVSGLVTEADHERLMFGSGRPVCALAGGWNRWAATVRGAPGRVLRT